MKHSNLTYCIGFLKRKAACYAITLLTDKILVSVCYNIVLAFIMKNIINGIAYKSEESFKSAFMIAVVSFLIAFIFQPIINKLFNYSIRTTLGEIRLKVFEHLQNLKAKEFEKFNSGDVLSRMTNDIDMLEDIYMNNIPNFVFAILHGSVAIVAMFFENIILAFIATSLGLISVIVSNIISKKIEKYSSEYQNKTDILNQQIIDIEDGFDDIKTNEAENEFYKRMCLISNSLKKLYFKKENQMSKASVLSNFFSNINLLGILFIGIYMAISNKISIGSVLAIIHLQGNAEYLFSTFSEFLGGIRKNLPSCGRLVEFLKLEEENNANIKINNTLKIDTEKNVLSIRDLCFLYNDQEKNVIESFNLNIENNSITAIVGESGCGKSTLSKLLLGFYEISEGNIYLHGKSIFDISKKSLREMISYVPQDSHLFQMSILDNIKLGKQNANMKEVEKACKLAEAYDFILELEKGFDTIIHENCTNISGGQKQRIALARAFLKNSEILIIDEGTKALDIELEKRIIDNLKNISKNKAIIAISHRELILKQANSICKMINC